MNAPWLVAGLAGAALALVNSAHCLTMCGPLAAAAQARSGSRASVHYLLGRSASYGALGLLAGSIGQGLALTPWARWAEALFAWAFALLLVSRALGYLGLARERGLVTLGRAPKRATLGRLLARVADDPLLLGALSALLPCATLYAAVLASAAFGRPLEGALFMLSFALVTSPVILGGAQLARLGQLGLRGRRALGAALILGALLTALRPLPLLHAESAAATCPLHAHTAGAP